jgi:heat shock protein 4
LCLYLKLLDPIENRYKNEEVRAQATRDLSKCIVDHRMAAKSLPTPEQYAVERECTKAEQWLWERSQLQESLPKNVDPALWSHEINKKKKHELDMFCRNIARHKGSPARADSSGVSDHMHKTDRG